MNSVLHCTRSSELTSVWNLPSVFKWAVQELSCVPCPLLQVWLLTTKWEQQNSCFSSASAHKRKFKFVRVFFFFFLFTNAVPTITMSNVIWTARNQNCKQQLHKDLKCTLLQLTKPVWVPGHSPCWMISSKHIYTCSRHIYKKKGLITDGTQQMSELQLNKQLEVWACYNYYTWWILDRKEQK